MPTPPAPDAGGAAGGGRRPNVRAGALFVALDPASREPLHAQLYRGIRLAITEGRLAPGARLPSTRALAGDLAVSRSTVVLAVAQLTAEGFLTSHPRSGSRVATTPPDSLLTTRRAPFVARPVRPLPPPSAPRDLGRAGRRAVACDESSTRLAAAPRPFRPGVPALDHFPSELWARLAARRYRQLSFSLLDDADPAGYGPLRAAIAAHVRTARGVRCAPEQVVVTSGAQQALALAAHVLLDAGDRVWMEDPGYPGMRSVLALAGADVVPVPVDADGLDVAEGVRRAPRARLAYATPSHQFPLGVTLSAARREALLDWAAAAGAWVVEDDYDNECRYAGPPLPALHALDAAHRVLYVGTFSKTVFPSLRIGYLVAPPDLVGALTRARAITGGHPSPVEQAVLADFVADGHFARHVRRMRALYADRQQRLVRAAERELRGLAAVPPSAAGLHLLAWLREGVSDRAAADALARRGVEAPPLSRYYAAGSSGTSAGALLLGYGALDDVALRDGVRTVREVLAQLASEDASARGRRDSA